MYRCNITDAIGYDLCIGRIRILYRDADDTGVRSIFYGHSLFQTLVAFIQLILCDHLFQYSTSQDQFLIVLGQLAGQLRIAVGHAVLIPFAGRDIDAGGGFILRCDQKKAHRESYGTCHDGCENNDPGFVQEQTEQIL